MQLKSIQAIHSTQPTQLSSQVISARSFPPSVGLHGCLQSSEPKYDLSDFLFISQDSYCSNHKKCTLSNALHCYANSSGILLEVLNEEVEAGAQLQELLVPHRGEPPHVTHCPNHHLGNR